MTPTERQRAREAARMGADALRTSGRMAGRRGWPVASKEAGRYAADLDALLPRLLEALEAAEAEAASLRTLAEDRADYFANMAGSGMSHENKAPEIRGVRLVISYDRLSDSHRLGTVNITSEGAESWEYGCIGSHHGAQCEVEGDDERVMEFGARLAALIREHYGAVPPLIYDWEDNHS